MSNEWNDITTSLDHATARSLHELNQYELQKLEVLLDHWHKIARHALAVSKQKTPTANA